MRQITTREKAFLSVGALAAVVIFVWLVMLPMLEGGGAEQKSSLEEMQERLAAVQELATISPMLIDLEANIREQSGYKKMPFKRGSASPAIIRYIAQAANEAGIKELDQLNAKLDTSKRSKTDVIDQNDILKSIVDQLYMEHVLDEVKRAAEAIDENADEDDPPDEQPDPDTSEESSDASEELSDPPENPGNEESDENDDSETVQAEESTESDVSEEPEASEAPEDVKQAETKRLPLFKLVPKDIPHEVRESLAESIKARQGKTLGLVDIDKILENAGVEDESEVKRIKGRLKGHSEGVRQEKDEMVGWLGDVGISQAAIASERMKKYAIKMVFKSKIDQLVKFLYNVQDSARWLRVDSMRIGISDRKETTLSVELSMTATVLYGLEDVDETTEN